MTTRSKELLERKFFSKGQTIVREGDEAYVAYLVQTGSVRVYTEKKGRRHELAVLQSGEIFGEAALVQDVRRTASVEAAEDCTLIVITRDAFELKIIKSDATIRAVLGMLSKRISSSNAALLESREATIGSFVVLLNKLFHDWLAVLPDDDKAAFKAEAFPVMRDMIRVIEKYRDRLE